MSLVAGKGSTVDIIIPLEDGISLKLPTSSTGGSEYPTAKLQKGLLLQFHGQDLAEEGVGFGVPVVQFGIQTVFPGGIQITHLSEGPVWEIETVYTMNLVERFARTGDRSVGGRWLYAAKDFVAAMHRRIRPVRGLLTAISNAVRWASGWRTTFEDAGAAWSIRARYAIHCREARVATTIDTTGLPGKRLSLVAVMNEQGARSFNRYQDSSGAQLHGRSIGSWQEVAAERASFLDITRCLAFSLRRISGTRLFRGHELVGSRLAWAGFGYLLPPTLTAFGYDLWLERLA